MPEDFGQWNDDLGHVIVAASEAEARELAAIRVPATPQPWWRDPKLTSCCQIEDRPPSRVVLSNVPTG